MYFKGINSYGDRGLVLDFGNETSKSISQEVNEAFLNISNLNLQSLNIVPSFNKIVVIFENSKIRDQPRSRGLGDVYKRQPKSKTKPRSP